ncbi:replication factor A protein 3 [Dipodascopsis uninucleata]
MSSADSEITPRTNAELLHLFVGRPVRLIGRVTSFHGDTVTLDAGGSVTARTNVGVQMTEGHAYEIIGRVNQDLSLKILDSVDFGTNINMDNANTLAALSNQYNEIFFDTS